MEVGPGPLGSRKQGRDSADGFGDSGQASKRGLTRDLGSGYASREMKSNTPFTSKLTYLTYPSDHIILI